MPYDSTLKPTDIPRKAMSVELDPPELGFRRKNTRVQSLVDMEKLTLSQAPLLRR